MDSEIVFERFNAEIRNALKYAHEEARILGHSHIGTTHLLLGLVCDPHSVACRVLQAMNLDLARVYHMAMPVASQVWSIGEEARLTEGARRAIEGAVYEANQLGHRDVGSEHLLLGLLSGQDEAAKTTLASLGASLDETRRQVLAVQALPQMPSTEDAPIEPIESARREHARQEYIRTHTALARRSRLTARGIALFILLSLFLVTYFFPKMVYEGYRIATILLHTFHWDIQFTPGWFALATFAGFLLVIGVLLLFAGLQFCISLVLSLRASDTSSRKAARVERLKRQGKFLLIILVSRWLFVELGLLLWAILPQSWWLWMALVWFFYSTVMTRFGSELILSRRHKITPLPESKLAQQLTTLVERLKTPIRGIFVMNKWDKPLRATAFCVGWGRTSHIILTDTLVQYFPPDEIEVIVAHELGHCVRLDTWRRVIVKSLGILCLLAAIQYLPPQIRTGFKSSDVLSVFFLCILCMFGVLQSLYFFYIRCQEYWADEHALLVTGKVQVFKNAMTRLASTNFVPVSSQLSRFSMTSHPTLFQRLKHADKFAARQGRLPKSFSQEGEKNNL